MDNGDREPKNTLCGGRGEGGRRSGGGRGACQGAGSGAGLKRGDASSLSPPDKIPPQDG
ncbi:hypothetical protein [Desulfobotulus mexicanus]|uniref:hypothetical protein n=1 Tax=Desulfobotulus mexicanus TaxID=2586642 RepID=UPI0015D168BA|nr:hypothetical protein [Desulfobotulus mexicanus]